MLGEPDSKLELAGSVGDRPVGDEIGGASVSERPDGTATGGRSVTGDTLRGAAWADDCPGRLGVVRGAPRTPTRCRGGRAPAITGMARMSSIAVTTKEASTIPTTAL
jgi:hypothetical protein